MPSLPAYPLLSDAGCWGQVFYFGVFSKYEIPRHQVGKNTKIKDLTPALDPSCHQLMKYFTKWSTISSHFQQP
jgi:hypothetical protein